MSLLRVPRVTLPRLVSTGRWFSSESIPSNIRQDHIHTKVCTPIYYVNGEPHIGHIYSTTFADAICRWNNMKGFSSYLTTGTDEHGQKVQKEAIKRKMDVRAYCDSVASSFKNELNHYSLNIGRFIRTTDPDHVQVVHSVWNQLVKNDDLYEANYQGYYCRSDEAFLTSKQICEKDGQLVSLENNNAVEWIEEKNWMFRLQKYKPQLLEFLQQHPDWITPSNFQKDCINLLKENQGDLSVSRPLSRVPWSIPMDDEHGIYVWIDALSNYITTNQHASFDQTIHVFGKDIVKFHCFYYPCLLMALNLPLPQKMICHNHWTVNDAKISKSKGNYIPLESLRRFIPGELIRFYLLIHDTLQKDGNFSTHLVLQSVNQLADIYGNLVMRSLSKSIAGTLLDRHSLSIQCTEETRKRLLNLTKKVTERYDAYSFCEGYELILNELKSMNQFFNDKHPWTIAKEIQQEQSTNASQLGSILIEIWESLRVCSILLQPIIPTYSRKVIAILNSKQSNPESVSLEAIRTESVQIENVHCYTDRLFSKLSKQEEALFLNL